MHKLYK